MKNRQSSTQRTGVNRRAFLASAAVAGFAATASGLLMPRESFAADEPQRGGHLVLGLDGGQTTDVLDPGTYAGSTMFLVGFTWGDRLVTSDPVTGEALPSLAESWTSSDDAKVWTFKLRKDVRFHDGSAYTINDAVQTLRRHSDKNSTSAALGLLEEIKTIEDKGGDLVITLNNGNADLPLLLTDYHLQIQKNGGMDDPNSAIGTGPYKLESFEPGIRITFSKNEDDWNEDRGFVDSVEVLVINDNTARIAALSSGKVHFINTLSPKTMSLLSRAPTIETISTKGKGFYSFLMHGDTAPFDNNDLRMALKLVIDREAMLNTVLGGYGTLGNDYPVNDAYALAPTGIPQRAYDPEEAAHYFKKSAHEGPVLLRTSDAAFTGAVDASVLFQANAKKAGIDIQLQREPADGYWSNVWNKKPFCASYWGGRATQDVRYTTTQLSTSTWNDTRFKDPAFDKKLLEARAETDTEKRRELYREMAMTVRDNSGLILPVFNNYLNARSVKMKGWIDDVGNDLSNGQIASRAWLAS
ncbi:MAG: ABC transporter substrate-binding protein [Alphaproteobacteria bacterium]|nr:ABC transporter substrate-binding protein [Alphaproteobacteria bacterium]MBU1548637.1 ABC transporter substrate-binding protein [Alphaproteobacteria bacterium]MBU2334391.1 ABC transporter substrate-binding protein [Alphaproteobacteria bacterium]MBU2389932.1 ABC transporter substrate-binding protein [Alphaproteobacteria bacterium]